MPARVQKVVPAAPDEAAIREAAAILTAGGLVAFPTETVYGLGADAMDARAVARIFAAKGRPADNPIIVHLADAAMLSEVVASVPARARLLISRCWPGPLTLVLPASPAVPKVTRGGLPTVAVRVPAHRVAIALIRAAGRPIAAPSANRSGRPSPTTAQHVLADLGDAIDLVLDAGPTPLGVESTVLDLTRRVPTVLRPGGVPLETLQDILGKVSVIDPRRTGAAVLRRSPGTRYRHYAPRADMYLVEGSGDRVGADVAAVVRSLWSQGLRVGVMVTVETAPAVPPGAVVRVMGRRDDPATIAARLFAQLRELDDAGLDAIVVEGIAERGLGRAVMDRLRRAAGLTNRETHQRATRHKPG
jgi:L-threonylcarbamoyladenylate synthase